ncbi:MAG: hypothetical protein JWM12_1504 [Ilumatobacteraceae bacterium]|nr:hypothetical protein [Ilumatobacteraceae bacterium]
MAPAEIISHRRVRLLALGDKLGNVAEACRLMGVSRTQLERFRGTVLHECWRPQGSGLARTRAELSHPGSTTTTLNDATQASAAIHP